MKSCPEGINVLCISFLEGSKPNGNLVSFFFETLNFLHGPQVQLRRLNVEYNVI